MALVNHLRNREAQRKVLAIAAGRHVVDGHVISSYTVGSDPTHNIYIRHALAEGPWEGPEGVWYRGLNVPSTDYRFLDGTQTATSDYFDTDVPHFRTVIMDVKTPTGVDDADTQKVLPDGFFGIFKTEKFPHFNIDGDQVDEIGNVVADLGDPLDESYFTYSANPARVIVGWMLKYGKINPDRIHWPKWVAWHDYCIANESVDYTAIPDFDGFGLRGSYYSGTNFDTFVSSRIDPVIEFPISSGAPAVDLPVDSFSVEWIGYIKALYDEEYTFTIEADNGAYLEVNKAPIIDEFATDGSTTPATHTGTINLSANAFYDIKVKWNEGGMGPALFRLKWQSASQPLEVIPPEVLYPPVEDLPRYETHVAFSEPDDLDTMMETVLLMSNSIKQDVDGKIEFYCVEDLSPSFHVQEHHVIEGSMKIAGADLRSTQLQNVWEAKFRDLDSQYLEEPISPILIEVADLIAAAGGRKIYGQPIDLQNMTRWQARKVLQHLVNRSVLKPQIVEFIGRAQTYSIVARDIIQLTHSAGDFATKQFEVIEATDNTPEETVETRLFRLQEW